MSEQAPSNNILWLQDLRLSDLAQVGGKNSSLGEMIGELSGLGVSVPGSLDVEDVPALTAAGAEIRGWVIDAPLQPALERDIRDAYAKLCADNG